MLEHVSGLTIRSVCADLATFHARRERPPQSGETFGAAAGAGTSSAVDTEDFGSMLFHLGDRARGAVTVSQTSAGRKNSLRIEINGTKASVAWTQDRPDELWIGRRDNANEILLKDPSLLLPGAAEYADYPGGHGEGYSDTFKQVFRRFYQSIREPAAACDYPTFADGLRQIRILDAALASHKRRGWVDVERD
jgi:predicted dehydrogenase